MNQKWRKRYIGLALEVSEFSEDESSKVGAYIANPETKRPVSFGYNGLPSGILDRPERHRRPEKYLYFEHAERNSIYNADRQLDGMAIFVTHCPCADCVRAIIQNRIKEVYVLAEFGINSTWAKERYNEAHLTAIQSMLFESGITVYEIDRNGNLV